MHQQLVRSGVIYIRCLSVPLACRLSAASASFRAESAHSVTKQLSQLHRSICLMQASVSSEGRTSPACTFLEALGQCIRTVVVGGGDVVGGAYHSCVFNSSMLVYPYIHVGMYTAGSKQHVVALGHSRSAAVIDGGW